MAVYIGEISITMSDDKSYVNLHYGDDLVSFPMEDARVIGFALIGMYTALKAPEEEEV